MNLKKLILEMREKEGLYIPMKVFFLCLFCDENKINYLRMMQRIGN